MKLIKSFIFLSLFSAINVTAVRQAEVRQMQIQPAQNRVPHSICSHCSWKVVCGICIFGLIATYIDRSVNIASAPVAENDSFRAESSLIYVQPVQDKDMKKKPKQLKAVRSKVD